MSMMLRRAIVGGGGWVPTPPIPPGWTPSDISGIMDWGIYSDTSRLKQNTSGTIAVTGAGQPVSWWRGQMDVLTLNSTAGGLTYSANGISNGVVGTYLAKSIAGVAQTSSKFAAVASYARENGENKCSAYYGPTINGGLSGLWCSDDGGVLVRGGTMAYPISGSFSPVTTMVVTQYSATQFNAFSEGASPSLGQTATGSAMTTLDNVGISLTSTSGPAIIRAWAFGNVALSDVDAARLAYYFSTV